MVTTIHVSVSEVRTYPAGTAVRVATNLRDLDANGDVKDDRWVFVVLPDKTMLAYPQSGLAHAKAKKRYLRRSAPKKEKRPAA